MQGVATMVLGAELVFGNSEDWADLGDSGPALKKRQL